MTFVNYSKVQVHTLVVLRRSFRGYVIREDVNEMMRKRKEMQIGGKLLW